MKVRVILCGQSLLVEPDPAVALVGEPMYWEFIAGERNRLIRWEVYFRNGTPFGSALERLTAETEFAPIAPGSSPTHHGLSPSAVAVTPGDYEYSVCAHDANTNQTIAECDPQLIILS